MTTSPPPNLLEAAANPTNRRPLLDWSQIDWVNLLTNLAVALVILALGFWLSKWISRLVYRALARGHVEHTLASFLKNLVHAVVMVMVMLAAMQKLGVPITSLLAIVGAAGLAVGLALKDSLSNIASGVMLVMLHPFREGDNVLVAGLEGVVEEIRIFQTRLRTADNRLIVLPNSLITTAPIINFTAKPNRRVDIAVGVGYGDDLKKAREILLALAAANSLVLKEPAPDVLVDKLGESSVNLILQAWVRTPDFGAAKSRLTEAARTEIIGHGLSIPFPQRDLRVFHYNAEGTPLLDAAARSAVDDANKPG